MYTYIHIHILMFEIYETVRVNLVIGNIFYFLFYKRKLIFFSYKKLDITVKIFINEDNFLELKMILIC